MKVMTLGRWTLAAAAAALLVTACGGGGGGGTPVAADPVVPGSDVPVTAATTSAGALAFVRSVAATSNDTASAITVGDAMLASSDTDEPDPGI